MIATMQSNAREINQRIGGAALNFEGMVSIRSVALKDLLGLRSVAGFDPTAQGRGTRTDRIERENEI